MNLFTQANGFFLSRKEQTFGNFKGEECEIHKQCNGRRERWNIFRRESPDPIERKKLADFELGVC